MTPTPEQCAIYTEVFRTMLQSHLMIAIVLLLIGIAAGRMYDK